jgi:hypothetical protein
MLVTLPRISRRTLAATLAATAAYALVARPWQLHWGAAEDEVRQTLPGDHLVPAPRLRTTRATTILAPPGKVWPWLLQIGYQRGGFYSYDRLEDLAGLKGITSADRINPELQQLAQGDRLLLAPETRMDVAVLEPGRALVLHVIMSPFTARVIAPEDRASRAHLDWSWAFVLEALGPRSTRLIVRVRGDYRPGWIAPLFFLIVEPAHFTMERKMLLGIKARAEAAGRSG